MTGTPAVSLEGAYDLHVHTAPDERPRWHTADEFASLAASAGMAGAVLKNHDCSTVTLAATVQNRHRALRIRGGLALNRRAGGLDPQAVEAALQDGAAIIWLPTKDGRGDPSSTGGALVTAGRPAPELLAIFELAAQEDVIVATGHAHADEVLTLVRAARMAGVRRLLVNHPEIPFLDYPVELQKALRDEGAYLERCYPRPEARDGFQQIASQIREVGVASSVLATDLGRIDLPAPLDGLRELIGELMRLGVSEGEIATMTRGNPGDLLP